MNNYRLGPHTTFVKTVATAEPSDPRLDPAGAAALAAGEILRPTQTADGMEIYVTWLASGGGTPYPLADLGSVDLRVYKVVQRTDANGAPVAGEWEIVGYQALAGVAGLTMTLVDGIGPCRAAEAGTGHEGYAVGVTAITLPTGLTGGSAVVKASFRYRDWPAR